MESDNVRTPLSFANFLGFEAGSEEDFEQIKDKTSDNNNDYDNDVEDVKNDESSLDNNDDKNTDTDIDSDSDTDVDTDEEDNSGSDDSSDDMYKDVDSDLAKYVSAKLSDKLGIDLGEHDNVDSIIDELYEIVEENSKPSYANEEIEKLDKFVRDGGDLRNFFEKVYEKKLSLDDIDIDDEKDQKRIIRESLKEAGYSENYIKNKIERYEEKDVLKDEAEEALEILKNLYTKREDALLKEQQKKREEAVKQQQNFVKNVQKYIRSKNEINGYKISDQDKKDIEQYLLRVDPKDGLTGYMRDYMKNSVESLVEFAFFKRKGDSIVKNAVKKGATDSLKDIKKKLSQKGIKSKKSGSVSNSNSDALDILSSYLIGNKKR